MELAFGLALAVVLLFVVIAVPAGQARKAAETLRASRADAVVVGTYWAAGYTDFFLKPGPLWKYARGRGGRVLVVADRKGVELIRPRGSVSYGVIPWALVRTVRIEELSGPLASRPKLVFEIQGRPTPFADHFELLPEGKQERADADQNLAAMLSKRPAPQA